MVKPITAKERLIHIEGFLYGLRTAFTTDEKYSDVVDALEYIIEDLQSVKTEISNKEDDD